MSVNNKFITKVLNKVHPGTKITSESVGLLINLFHKYDDMTREQIIESTIGQLTIHATKYQTKEKVIEYLLAEVLELAGHTTHDAHRVQITPLHIWIGIINDEELTLLFPHPTVPIMTSAMRENKMYGEKSQLKKLYTPKVKMIDEYISSLILNKDAKLAIRNIVFQCNLYHNKEACIEKIKSLGETYSHDYEPLDQLRRIVLNKLRQTLESNIDNEVYIITFTDVDDTLEKIIKLCPEYGFLRGKIDS